ncbi:hypothetical protein [Rhizobium sp. BG4]|uniref:hypothetical protein n=1 Tax=Rhizobium sp. BG4 TaxID=2613770 RepID=UPI00193D6342|nr:hypothetical protein [Rhizobium sp. BG4]
MSTIGSLGRRHQSRQACADDEHITFHPERLPRIHESKVMQWQRQPQLLDFTL